MRVLLLCAALVSCTGLHRNPSALWEIVHGQCLPNQAAGEGAAPCAAVGRDDVLYKDQHGATHYLLIPTARRAGIEDPALLAPGSPNYWQDAWSARAAVGKHLRREQVGMGINAPGARSQDQLHIHLDCIRPGLEIHAGELTLRGIRYHAWAIAQEDLAGLDPFKFLAAHIDDSMGNHALTVVGAVLPDGKPGFYLLESAASGEALLDRSCAISAAPAAP